MFLCLWLVFTVLLTLPLRVWAAVEMKRVYLGQTVTLRCNMSVHYEIFWLRVSLQERPRLLMVAGLKSDGTMSEIWNINETHFQGCLVDRFFALKISRVLKSDLASYYCGTLDGKRMRFEEGIHIYATDSKEWRERRAGNSSDCEEDEASSGPEDSLSFYSVFAAVLAAGQLMMVLAVVVVHIICWKKNRLNETSKTKPG